jgi:hypothetical protein
VELNSGITAQIDRNTVLYANAGYQLGVDGRWRCLERQDRSPEGLKSVTRACRIA